jgi:hypothetical protein
MAFVAAAAPYERTVSDDQWLRWPLPELLGQLAGNPIDLPTLLHDFAATLTPGLPREPST